MSSTVGRVARGGVVAAFALVLWLPAPVRSAQVTINLSLDRYANVTQLSAGGSAGVSPVVARIHVGDSVVFVNEDAKSHHTATGLPGAARFSEPRWTDAMLKPSGSIGPAAWSTGDLAPGARSVPIQAAAAGTFLYGCFFDYTAGMRGQIVVEP